MLAFAHISDLHFSDVMLERKRYLTRHQGPHDPIYCKGLQNALNRIRLAAGLRKDEQMGVVVSGDLTRTGSMGEFGVAQTFMREHPRMSRQHNNRFGIAVDDDHLGAVPGNHDQWQGQGGYARFAAGVPASNPALRGVQFKPTPWHKRWNAPDRSVALDLFGIDSSSDFSQGQRNYFQRGTISDHELNQLEDLLRGTPVEPHVARAVVCHHSIAFKTVSQQMEALDAASRARLVRICRGQRVSAILTGHTHDLRCEPIATGAGQGTRELWELRSGATVAVPPVALPGQAPQVPGFLVHSIRASGAKVSWTARQVAWGLNAFDLVAGATQTIPIS